jgi:hypothetical protein
VKYIVLSLILLVAAGGVTAQNTPSDTTTKKPQTKKEKKAARKEYINTLIRQEQEGEIIFNKQHVFGIKLATDGYGLSYEIGKYKADRRANLFQIELSEKKHPKEKKQGASVSQYQVNSVIPGKMNNFYQAKFIFARQRVIGGKGNKNGVSVSANYGGGLSLGLLKPYYVDVKEGQRVRWDKIVDSNFVPLGASGFTVGWGEVKARPGVLAKGALRFDYGRLNETVTAIEVGASTEYYFQGIEQMLFNKHRQFFFSAYVTLLLGRRK